MTEYKEKGNQALKNKDYKLALEFYDKAISSEPSNHVHYSNRSLCLIHLEQYKEALNDAEECIRLNKSFAKGYQRKGCALQKLGNIWDSFVYYSYGNLYDPNNENIKSELKDSLEKFKKMFQSKMMELFNSPAMQNLMKDTTIMNDLINPSASTIFERSKTNPDLVEVIAKVLNIDKDSVQKDVDHYFIIKINKESSYFSNNSFNEKKDNSQANKNTTNTTNENSNNSSTNNKILKGEEAFNKANNLFVCEDYENALEKYDLAISTNHNNLSYLINRAACYLKLGDEVLALEDCNYALKKGLCDARVYYLKTVAYRSLNKVDQAKESLDEGLKLYPNNEKLLKLKK